MGKVGFHNTLYRNDTLSEPSKLLDNSVNPSLENLSAVISSVWPFPTYMSGLLPHPALMFHICKKMLSKLTVFAKQIQ